MFGHIFSPLSARRRSHPGCTGGRREFLWQMGAGFAGLALGDLLLRDSQWARRAVASETSSTTTNNANPFAVKPPHFPAKAKHVIFLFMYGGPSQVDTWDYKPELQKRGGQS